MCSPGLQSVPRRRGHRQRRGGWQRQAARRPDAREGEGEGGVVLLKVALHPQPHAIARLAVEREGRGEEKRRGDSSGMLLEDSQRLLGLDCD